MNNRPWRPPPYRLEKTFKGRVIHSVDYKDSAPYHGRRVAVVGLGNSAVEIACDLATVAEKVYLLSRRASWLVPLSNPAGDQVWDLSYNSRLHVLGRRIVPKLVRNWLWENCSTVGIVGAHPEHRFLAANFTFGQSLPLHMLSGRVVLRPDLLSFTGSGLEYVDRSVEEAIDDVIFCTGFKFDFPFVEQGSLIHVRYNDFHLYKHMFLPDLCEHNNLAVIGHVQVGGEGRG